MQEGRPQEHGGVHHRGDPGHHDPHRHPRRRPDEVLLHGLKRRGRQRPSLTQGLGSRGKKDNAGKYRFCSPQNQGLSKQTEPEALSHLFSVSFLFLSEEKNVCRTEYVYRNN